MNTSVELGSKPMSRITADKPFIVYDYCSVKISYFSCYTAEKILMGVHYLRVMENDRTREIVANLEMFFRFAAFTFIFALIIGQVMK